MYPHPRPNQIARSCVCSCQDKCSPIPSLQCCAKLYESSIPGASIPDIDPDVYTSSPPEHLQELRSTARFLLPLTRLMFLGSSPEILYLALAVTTKLVTVMFMDSKAVVVPWPFASRRRLWSLSLLLAHVSYHCCSLERWKQTMEQIKVPAATEFLFYIIFLSAENPFYLVLRYQSSCRYNNCTVEHPNQQYLPA